VSGEVDALFVYGSLLPGRRHAALLEAIAGRRRKAFLRGRFYPQGVAGTEGYPALVPDAGADEVAGLLLESTALAAHWPRLDAFEGAAYRRLKTLVRCDDGRSRQAWVYVPAGLCEPRA